MSPDFVTFLRDKLRPLLCVVAIDEAHVITDWGTNDFRQDYAKMSELLCISQAPAELLLSGTFPQEKLDKTVQLLCMENVTVIADIPDREEIYIQVSYEKPKERLNWLLNDL